MSQEDDISQEEEDFGYPLTGDELREIIGTPGVARLTYFMEKVNETGQVWTIGADDELIVLSGDDEEPFVVCFPHPEFGQDWFTTTEIEDVDLVAVRTEDWVREILPGLEESKIEILVFPTSEGEGVLLAGSKLAEMLSAAQAE